MESHEPSTLIGAADIAQAARVSLPTALKRLRACARPDYIGRRGEFLWRPEKLTGLAKDIMDSKLSQYRGIKDSAERVRFWREHKQEILNANSITGVNDDIIAQNALMALHKKLQPLMSFSTDFSGDARQPGEKISVLRETYPNDAVATKATHAAYTIQDADSDAVEISLGQPKYVSYALDDTEIAQSSVVNMEVYGAGKGNHLANGILTDIWGLITNTNFSTAAFVGAASTFDADDVADIKDALDDADVPPDGRSLVLGNAYLTNLIKDNAIQSAANLGSAEVIREGSIGRLMGFDVYSSNVIPDNSENLVGFACHRSAIAVAMRYLAPQDGNTYHRAEALTDPQSGITIGLRDWYDNSTGQRKRVLEVVHGKVVGIAGALKRITSA